MSAVKNCKQYQQKHEKQDCWLWFESDTWVAIMKQEDKVGSE